jgi:putative transposase
MFELVHAERVKLPVAVSCRALGVSRSGYYRWVTSEPSARVREDAVLATHVRDIHREHKGRYGSPRIHRELRGRGYRVGRKRVARLMCEEGLQGRRKRRFRRTTDSRHGYRIARNLLNRDFSATRPDEVWVGDITYVPTREGWLYLAVLVDLFSRRVVGWAMSDHIDTELALAALQMAHRRRQPARRLIHHTDRDCRYASDEYRAALKVIGAKASMSRKADCWDNAVAESFFATLEKELLGDEPIRSRERTRVSIANYIEDYYNTSRRHSYLDYVSPIEYEVMAAA